MVERRWTQAQGKREAGTQRDGEHGHPRGPTSSAVQRRGAAGRGGGGPGGWGDGGPSPGVSGGGCSFRGSQSLPWPLFLSSFLPSSFCHFSLPSLRKSVIKRERSV